MSSERWLPCRANPKSRPGGSSSVMGASKSPLPGFDLGLVLPTDGVDDAFCKLRLSPPIGPTSFQFWLALAKQGQLRIGFQLFEKVLGLALTGAEAQPAPTETDDRQQVGGRRRGAWSGSLDRQRVRGSGEPPLHGRHRFQRSLAWPRWIGLTTCMRLRPTIRTCQRAASRPASSRPTALARLTRTPGSDTARRR